MNINTKSTKHFFFILQQFDNENNIHISPLIVVRVNKSVDKLIIAIRERKKIYIYVVFLETIFNSSGHCLSGLGACVIMC